TPDRRPPTPGTRRRHRPSARTDRALDVGGTAVATAVETGDVGSSRPARVTSNARESAPPGGAGPAGRPYLARQAAAGTRAGMASAATAAAATPGAPARTHARRA